MNRAALSICLLSTGTIGMQRADAVGDTRTISLHHVHTKEDLTITYKKNGQYDEEALKKINWIMRDWRKNEPVKMDPQTIDLMWEVYQEVAGKEPIHIICGYRSAGTNEMLRSRSRRSGVARHSQHTLGKAIDFYVPGVPLERLREAAMKAQGGGVGYYPTSGSPFVHLDAGNVRAWPRMTREQLVKLFPDGRTVHLPADGNPLPGYELARADVENRQSSVAAEPKRKSLLAALFGTDKDADEVEDNTAARETPARNATAKPAPAQVRTQVASAGPLPVENTPAQAAVPLPPKRPAIQVAAAEKQPAPGPRPTAPVPAPPVTLASLSPSQIVEARGFWEIPAEVSANMTAAAETKGADISSARQRLAASMASAVSRDTTASVNPFPRQDPLQGLVLAYADAADGVPGQAKPIVNTVAGKGIASVVNKSIDTANSRPTAERLNDPWMRGLMLARSMQNSLVVTPVGDPDYTGLVTFMRKPGSAVVMMTFSDDPHAGVTADQFAGSAVVFPPTLTFGPAGPPRRRTANLM